MDRLDSQRSGGGFMISDKVEMRELITLSGGGILLRGTHHIAAGRATDDEGDLEKRVGVLFLNPLSSPRSLIGDSAVYFASSFAARGYPAFRIDLPGLGDSYGRLPNDLLTFINEGGFAAITASKIKELVQRFSLSGVVIYGHCAAATSAIYAALECKECKGLIVTDPYFYLTNRLTPKLKPELVDWARRTKLGEVLRAIYARMREAPKKLRSGALPPNANVTLVAGWKKVLSSGLPILVLKAPQPTTLGSSKLRSGSFDYLAHVTSFAVRSDQVTTRTIDETDHSFANQLGRAAVQGFTEAWLREYFPVEQTEVTYHAQVQGSQSAEINPVTLGTSVVPAFVSSGE
jgi:pimeloyl-ACP methyl ester carboxylesterase